MDALDETRRAFIGSRWLHQQVDAWADQSLLDSLESGGVNWPSSCRNGTCRTCMGQLVSGSVHYDIEWPGVTTEEQAEGYVLPCCAYPDSDVVLKDHEYL